MLDGLLLVDKDPDCTSHDVVQDVRRILHQRKVGHCGTLDPGATGLLVLTLGRATRLTRFLIRAPKIYEGEIRFGATTDTYDRFGTIVETAPTDGLEPDRIAAAMERLVGTYEQAAPPYSAKKVGGTKYYQLARRGEEVPESTKTVTVFEFTPTAPPGGDSLSFRLGCSSGTYVRTVAHDLGRLLGCGAHLHDLRRLKVGPFAIERAARVAELRDRGAEDPRSLPGLVPFDDIPLPFGDIQTDAQQEQRIAHGQTILVRALEGAEGDWVRLTSRTGRFLGVGTINELIGTGRVGVVQPRIVFV